ncbi:MAG: hypothetical protein CMP10_17665 [Zetaproteobacteria bacterium]|nr:hypothetical protein [Pseudobdellovibrionaceae bacterium]
MKIYKIAFLLSMLPLGCSRDNNSLSNAPLEPPSPSQLYTLVDGVFSAVGVLNRYKTMSANVLEDNESISSVPVNYKSLNQRHFSWTNNFASVVESYRPNWAGITTEVSYQQEAQKVRRFMAVIPGDQELRSAEGIFLSDVVNVDNNLERLQKDIKMVLAAGLKSGNSQRLGPDGQQLRDNLAAALDGIAAYRQSIDVMQANVQNLRERRRLMRLRVGQVWQRVLAAQLHKVNATNAQTIVERVHRVFLGEDVRVKFVAKMTGYTKRVNAYLETLNSPLHARRRLYAALGYLNKFEAKLTAQEFKLSASDRASITALVNDYRNHLVPLKSEVSAALSQKKAFFDERKRVTLGVASRFDLSNECRRVGFRIVNPPDRDSTLDQESRFIRFKKSCSPI